MESVINEFNETYPILEKNIKSLLNENTKLKAIIIILTLMLLIIVIDYLRVKV